jgi:hypothetical protein
VLVKGASIYGFGRLREGFRVEHPELRAFYELRTAVPEGRIMHFHRIDWPGLGAAATVSGAVAAILWLPFIFWRHKKEA